MSTWPESTTRWFAYDDSGPGIISWDPEATRAAFAELRANNTALDMFEWLQELHLFATTDREDARDALTTRWAIHWGVTVAKLPEGAGHIYGTGEP